jgi:hypothetical protein
VLNQLKAPEDRTHGEPKDAGLETNAKIKNNYVYKFACLNQYQFYTLCYFSYTFYVTTVSGKGKVRPRIGHEGTQGEQMYSSTLSLTSALDRVGG